MATPITTLAHIVEPWKDAYAASRVLGVAVVFGHLGALLIGGGVAVSTDLATLRAFRSGSSERIRQLGAVRASHRIVIAALTVLFVTGVLLLASDLDTFWGSPWLGMKLAFVTLLL